jgi:hypothetical protein
LPVPALAVIEGPGRDLGLEHLFEAEGLGAELDEVGHLRLATSPLVFDGKRLPASRAAGEGDSASGTGVDGLELDHVSHAEEAPLARGKPEPADNADPVGHLRRGLVDSFVQQPALGRLNVFDPQPLDVNKRTAARTELQVLEG